jgi:predicted DNA repair protein MutK
MSVGLLAVVDDILTAAVKASAKTAGVVIDDAAVTPQYVQGVLPARELPIVGKIALGSLVNKFVIIIPIALLLTAFAPWVLPWLLIVGGSYLCFEGAEKVMEWFGAEHGPGQDEPRNERKLVFGAIRTDLILSTEIMLISLASLDAGFGLWMTFGALAVIALAMTLLVYGAVALLVKIDDIGMGMAQSSAARVRSTGERIVRSMPTVFRIISVIGTVAMLWVGGHLVIANLAETLWEGPYNLLHTATHAVESLGPVVEWVIDTALSGLFGLMVGLIIAGIVFVAMRVMKRKAPVDASH